MPNNIAVSITADVLDLQAKRAILSAELKAATKDLNDFAKEAAASGSTDELRAGMLASAEAAQKARNSIAQVNTELKELAVASAPAAEHMKEGFGGLSVGMREMGISLRESIGVIGGMRAAMVEFGEAMIAAFAIEKIADWAKEMGEAAEKTEHLAETFGMTVPQVQGLQAVADMTGLSIDSLTRGMGIFDKNAVTAASHGGAVASAFKAVGVNANDGANQMQRLMTVADKFKDMDDGPKKVALAMMLFGKSGKDLIPVLNMGSEGIAELDRKTQEYSAGVLIATDANKQLRDWLDQVNAKGVALAESTNETKVAWLGLANVMTDAFAPMLKEAADGVNSMIQAFIESYREGGLVKEILEGIADVARETGTVISAFGEIVWSVARAVADAVTEISNAFGTTFQSKIPDGMSQSTYYLNVFKDDVIVLKDVVIAVIETISEVVQLFVGDMKRVAQALYDAFTLNWGAIGANWEAGTRHLEDIAAKSAARIKALMHDAWSANNDAKVGKDHAPTAGGGIPRPKGGGGDFDPELGGAKGHKGHKGHKESIAQQLDEELEAKKTAWAMEQDAQGTYQQFSLQSEADFWAQALKRTDLSAKDRLAVEKKYLAARAALLKEKQAAESEDAKQHEALSMEQAKTDVELARIGLQEQLAAIDEAEKAHQITGTRALQMKAEVNRQLYALDQKLENDEYAIKLKGLQQERAILGQKPEYYKRIDDQIELLEKQHQDRLVVLNKQADDKILADKRRVADSERQLYDQTFRPFAQSLSKMLTLQQGWAATLQQMWQNLQNVFARMIENMITNWLVGLTTRDAAEAASNQKSVIHDAKNAARKAFNAVVGIPIVGPILAPIAAATAFAAVEAFSAKGGDWDVSEGIYHLHEKEMVLPAHLASPLRSMIDGGGANDNHAGGDSHLHYSPTINGSTPKSLDQMLRDEGDSMLRWFGGAVRNGQIKVGG